MDIQTNVILNKKEVLDVVLKNILLLLKRRNLTADKFSMSDKEKNEFNENKVIYFDSDNNKISILFFDGDVKNISTGTMIDDFLNKNNEYTKFIICKSFAKKVYKQIEDIYKKAEIFNIYEFLEDIPSKKFIPDHQILNDEEKSQLLSKFKLSELSSMYKTDMMARYYGAKKNDVFRIKRYNLNSGISVVYRKVIDSNYDILF